MRPSDKQIRVAEIIINANKTVLPLLRTLPGNQSRKFLGKRNKKKNKKRMNEIAFAIMAAYHLRTYEELAEFFDRLYPNKQYEPNGKR